MRTVNSSPLGSVSFQAPHHSGSPWEPVLPAEFDFLAEPDLLAAPGGPSVSPRLRFQPAGARVLDLPGEPGAADSMADRRSAVIVKFILAGSATRGGGALPGS